MIYVIVSDIHANYAALQAVLNKVSELRVQDSDIRYWFLGDLLGYGPSEDAIECVRWLRHTSGIYPPDEVGRTRRWVPGNHDEWIVKQQGPARPEAIVTLLHQRTFLGNQYHGDWAWFKREVREAIAEEQGTLLSDGDQNLMLVFTHAAVVSRRIQYLRPWNKFDLMAAFGELNYRDKPLSSRTTCLIHGHTHLAVVIKVKDKSVTPLSIQYGKPIALQAGNYIINPGSVGHPRDGDPRASFAILNTDVPAVTFYRVPYPVKPVVNRLLAQGNTYAGNKEAITYILSRNGNDLSSRACARYFEKLRNEIYPRLRREIEEGHGGEEEKWYQSIYTPTERGLEVIVREE